MMQFLRHFFAEHGTQRRRTDRGSLRAVALLGIVFLGISLLLGTRSASAPLSQVQLATITAHPVGSVRLFDPLEVVSAFRAAGLPVDNFHQQPLGPTGPSGPPATEREAWAFSIPTIAPSGGRLLIFADNDSLNKKAMWYKHSGAGPTITTHGNVILWLDPTLTSINATYYRQVLEALS